MKQHGPYRLMTMLRGAWSIYCGWLVVGIPTPLKNDGLKVSWDDYIFPIWWESHNPFMFQSPPRINGAHTTGAGWTCFLRRWEQTATSSNTFFCVSSISAIAETMGPKICLPEHETKYFDEWFLVFEVAWNRLFLKWTCMNACIIYMYIISKYSIVYYISLWLPLPSETYALPFLLAPFSRCRSVARCITLLHTWALFKRGILVELLHLLKILLTKMQRWNLSPWVSPSKLVICVEKSG